ncbi:MAG: hypothetical protein ACHP84_20260 [Caulobacterales bacterium]
MKPPAGLAVEALTHAAERAALIAGMEQLAEVLGAAAGRPWPVRLNFRPPGSEVPAEVAPNVVIASLMPDVDRADETPAETESRWRTYLVKLQHAGAPVLMLTVFRRLANRANAGVPSPLLERIRQLNRMALELSHDLGVGVIDIDRAFAHIGGRALQTDYRLIGVQAAEVAGHTIAWSLLSFGLDRVVDPEIQEQAKTWLGSLQQINTVLRRRLERRRAAQTARG